MDSVYTQEYIDWVNGYLPQTEAVSDISGSLADGTIILKALSVSFVLLHVLMT